MKRLEGKLLIILCELQNNNTPIESTCSGVDLGPARLRILAENLAHNSSLKAIHMVRKEISDIDG